MGLPLKREYKHSKSTARDADPLANRMFREPTSSDASRTTIKVNTDPTARARSYIRRHVMRRSTPRSRLDDAHRSFDNNAAGDLARQSDMSPLRQSERPPGSPGNTLGQYNDDTLDLSSAYHWGVEPGSEEHTQLGDFIRSTAPLTRQARRRIYRRTSEDSNTSEDRRRILVLAQAQRAREHSTTTSNVPNNVTISPSSGLGDRRRSPSPEDAAAWEVLRATIPPDDRLPSASSSFASTASTSLSRDQSTRSSTDSSPATSIDVPGPGPAISLYSPQPSSQHPDPPPPYSNDEFTSLFVYDSASETSDYTDTYEPGPMPPLPAWATTPTRHRPTGSFPLSPGLAPTSQPADRHLTVEPTHPFAMMNRSPSRSPFSGTVSPAAVTRQPLNPDELEPLSEPRRRDFLISRMRDREERAAMRARAEAGSGRIGSTTSPSGEEDVRVANLDTRPRNEGRELRWDEVQRIFRPVTQAEEEAQAQAQERLEDREIEREAQRAAHAGDEFMLARWRSIQNRRAARRAAAGAEQGRGAELGRGTEQEREVEQGRLSPRASERRMELWRREHGRYGENLDVHELHARYARLQAQEEHLNMLIDRLCRGRPVPDRLWGLAGVERRGFEGGSPI
ncbi:MAG: hypothetical protein MMC23_004269 [Stictis urceolatum]|nr:hypothetical protein [Stictis urceolata]